MSKDIVYKVVTDSMIAALESAVERNDTAPWDKPWNAVNGVPMFMRKWSNGKAYRGINIWILLGSGRPGPWLTYKQATQVGGRIKPEEAKNYTVICFWKINKYKDKDNPDEEKCVPMLRYYRVYSLEQAEGLPEKRWMQKVQQAADLEQTTDPFEQAKALWDAFKDKPEVREGSDRAYYTLKHDYIALPDITQFTDKHKNTVEAYGHYYSTLYHEGIHSTAHPTRCARVSSSAQTNTMFGSESYSKEELIAEMGAAYLQAFAGITVKRVRENNVAYLRNWIKRLKDDTKLVVHAASKAQQACDYILGTTWKDDS